MNKKSAFIVTVQLQENTASEEVSRGINVWHVIGILPEGIS